MSLSLGGPAAAADGAWTLVAPAEAGTVWEYNGGQRLFIAPSLELVVVVMAGNHNRADAWKVPVAVITGVVLPSLKDDWSMIVSRHSGVARESCSNLLQ